jgi:hypothetical protein
MRMLKHVHNRLVLFLIFALACLRVVARVLPISRAARAANRNALRDGVQRGVLVRTARSDDRSYALQATGAFPYVKVSMAAPAGAVPVPLEIASLSPGEAKAAKKRGSHALTRKQAPTATKPFCDIEECDDCTDCGGCTDCTDCTDCTCGCTDCTDCSDCTTSDGVPI